LYEHRRMTRGGHGLLKVSPVPTMLYGRFRSGLPAGRAAFGRLLPLWTPHAVSLCLNERGRKLRFLPRERVPNLPGVLLVRRILNGLSMNLSWCFSCLCLPSSENQRGVPAGLLDRPGCLSPYLRLDSQR
jgi:hypothetical protein